MWQKIFTALRRYALPQTCFLCGSDSEDELLCPACINQLPHSHPSFCPQCGLTRIKNEICGACLRQTPHFDKTVYAFHYDFPIEQLIQALKYDNKIALAPFFALRLAQKIPDASFIDFLIPLPLHPRRLRQRGFNQALEIGRHIAKQKNIPLTPHVCTRIKDTQPQTALPWKQRHDNIRGAFSCNQDLSGKSIAVVDDVMTTGATLNEVAKILKKQGAVRVENWVVARTLPY